MKKIFLFIPILIFILAGCGGKKTTDSIDSVDTDSVDSDSTDADTADPSDSTDTTIEPTSDPTEPTETPDNENPDNEIPDNENPDNETPDNENSDNENPDKETPDNENPDNETPDNENPDNETPDNENPDNENPDNEIPDNESPDNETPDNENPDNETPDNETPDNENPDNENPDNEIPDNETPDNENPDNENPDNENPDNEIPDNETTDNETPDNENPDNENPDNENPDNENPDNETPDNDSQNPEELVDVFNIGSYEVKITDVASGTDGAPRDFRIYEPKDISGNIPVVHFQHGFMYKLDYYDGILTHLASHGFIVVSGKSDHKKTNGESSVTEANKVAAFINWLKENIQSKVSVEADVENFGVAGHDRGGKVSSRIVNRDDFSFVKGFFGVDPIDSTQSSSGYDANSIIELTTAAVSTQEECEALGGTWSGFLSKSCKNVVIDSQEKCEILGGFYFNGSKCYNNRANLPSMFLGTQKGESGSPACAPTGENSVDFYASYPAPSRHIIAAGVGHTDMVDPADISSCGSTCSNCPGSGEAELNLQFIKYTGGLMVAFFNSTLKGLTQYEAVIDDQSQHPFAATVNEHK